MLVRTGHREIGLVIDPLVQGSSMAFRAMCSSPLQQKEKQFPMPATSSWRRYADSQGNGQTLHRRLIDLEGA